MPRTLTPAEYTRLHARGYDADALTALEELGGRIVGSAVIYLADETARWYVAPAASLSAMGRDLRSDDEEVRGTAYTTWCRTPSTEYATEEEAVAAVEERRDAEVAEEVYVALPLLAAAYQWTDSHIPRTEKPVRFVYLSQCPEYRPRLASGYMQSVRPVQFPA